MKITVVGTGYVGLVSAVGFAEIGHTVICLGRDEAKMAQLRAGVPTLYEPGLEVALRRNIKRGRISFTTDRLAAYSAAPVIMIAVGTPSRPDGSADLTAVFSVARDIGRIMTKPKTVVVKSTVPVGTCEQVQAAVVRARPRSQRKLTVAIVSNPEFLQEGVALRHFMQPDRVVVGVADQSAAKVMAQLYRPITGPKRPLVVTDLRSSELIKYVSNAFLATKISFMNEIANFSDRVGADVDAIRRGVGLDPRIGPAFLRAGIGYGGACLPKDLSALMASGQKHGYGFRMLSSVRDVNVFQRQIVVRKLRRFLPQLRGKMVAVWGLSFKPKTDDVRDAPSLTLIRGLLKLGARVKAYDPIAAKEAKRVLGTPAGLEYSASASAAARSADALILVTEWEEFKTFSPRQLKRLMRRPIVVDGRNVFDPATLRRLGFKYAGIGRP